MKSFTAALLLAMPLARAGDLAFSDPAKVAPPPAHAIGFPNRAADLDALPGFRQPPPGYGEVAFYWWLGDPLTKERLAWQIEQLDKVKGVMGLQINYAHTDHGGRSYGLTFPSEPPLFSEPWWKLVAWFVQEAKQHKMAVSLSDYTLGFGQGWVADEILKEQPDLTGAALQPQVREVAAGEVKWQLPAPTVSVTAWLLDGGKIVPGSAVDLREHLANGVLKWKAPGPNHRLVAVVAQPANPSIDPMNPQSGPVYAKKFFGQFEDRNPGEGGKGLNFFFSDELGFGVGGNLWTPRFAAEFKQRKGYDVVPELAALFEDIGPRTPKVRLDYRDVMVSLTEEGFFKPCFDWHQQRGMIFGCDHGGRGRDVTEFGDYFRTQRWNQGPGCDQPGLARDVIKNKVASSIAHLYQRPRVWLEGYHSSGWGTNTEQLTAATFANFAQGQNLLTLHGLYYSTHGGFWEWAPPCNHFRMPYWAHMERYMASVQRLSYLLSQGDHRCDVAVMYPVAPMEAGLCGQESVDAAFRTGEHLYKQGIDFDFMDFESLARAQITDKELRVSGELYRVLVIPAMRAARWSTLQKALEFQRGGGLVIVLGALPEASDRAGRDDAQLTALVAQLTTRVTKPEEVAAVVTKAFPRDFAVLSPTGVAPDIMHRRLGPRDVFMVHNAPLDAECWFRATGKVELWDPWTGATRVLPVLAQTAGGTRLRLPMGAAEAQLVVFSPGEPLVAADSKIQNPEPNIALDGEWEFELQPTMDNRFGDFRWPPTKAWIGAEARRFRYAEETAANPGWQAPEFDDSKWPRVTQSFGPKFWKLGPLPPATDLDARLSALKAVDPSVPVEIGGRKFQWQPYDFSWQWGLEGDPGHQGYHGLKENVTDAFLCLGKRNGGHNETVYGQESGDTRYYLWSSVAAQREGEAYALSGGMKPAAVWLNHQRCDKGELSVRRGANPLLLRYDAPGRGYFVVSTRAEVAAPPVPEPAERTGAKPAPLAMKWFGDDAVLPFDTRPQAAQPAGWYRFTAPPGLRAMTITTRGKVRAWIDGNEVLESRQGTATRFKLLAAVPALAKVALRIEQARGCYGGAAVTDPVTLECAAGRMPLGDWSKAGALECYSGGAWYRKSVTLTPEQARGAITLDLGKLVSTAEVRVNGQPAGIRIAPPWRVDISQQAKPGDNRIEVLVYNTLANHYLTIPTNYRGDPTSGLLGPVTLEVAPQKAK
jgi:hypothetical protein